MKTTYKIIGVIVVCLVAFLVGLTTGSTSTEKTPADRIEIADPWGEFETQTLGDIIKKEIAQQLAVADDERFAEIENRVEELEERPVFVPPPYDQPTDPLKERIEEIEMEWAKENAAEYCKNRYINNIYLWRPKPKSTPEYLKCLKDNNIELTQF